MSKKHAKDELISKTNPTNQTESSENLVKKEIVYVNQHSGYSQYFFQFLFILLAFLMGLVAQNYLLLENSIESKNIASSNLESSSRPPMLVDRNPEGFDMDRLYKEISVRLKNDILNEFRNELLEKNKKDKSVKENVQFNEDNNENDSKNENEKQSTESSNKIFIDEQQVQQKSEIKFSTGDKPIVINPETVVTRTPVNKEKSKIRDKPTENKIVEEKLNNVPDEVKHFPSVKISKMKPKKMWIPVANSNGGHRRCPPMEITSGKEHGSSVKVTLFEEFLSEEESKSLIDAHESHLKEIINIKPIICYDSVATLRKQLIDLNKEKIAQTVTPLDFIQDTMCLNQTFSRQLEKWGLRWSFNTAFYPGESKFSNIFAKLIEEATQLNQTHGGKFQITSYPNGVGYEAHTSCILDSNEERDKYATFLVFLNELGADGGGEMLFPEMGIDVKPRAGRVLTWNNMNYETGKCEPASAHQSAAVKHEIKKKYVIQRHYYYKNFYALGKRLSETSLPDRPENTPKVSCSSLDKSCHLYDEWSPDHLLSYRTNQNKLF